MNKKFFLFLLLGLLYVFPNSFSLCNFSYLIVKNNIEIYKIIDTNIGKV